MKWVQVKALLLCLLLIISESQPEEQNTYYFNAEVTRYILDHSD